jgi:hypothetical protein
MIGLVVALPPLLLAGGALMCRWLPARLARHAPWLVVGAAWLALAATGAVMGAAFLLPERSVRLPLPGWDSAAFQVGMALDVNVLTACCLVLVCLVAAVASLRVLDGVADVRELAGPLLVAAAAALFVCAARVPLAVALAWVLLDAALFVGARGGAAGLLTGQVGFVCLLMGLFALPVGIQTLDAPNLGVAEAGRMQTWLLLAGAVRMGLYPLWWSVPRTERSAPWRGAIVRVAPVIAGVTLFLVAMESARPAEALDVWTLLPLALVLALAAGLAWLARDAVEALDWRVVAYAALVLLAIRPGGANYRSLGLVLLLNLVLAALVLYVTADVERHRGVVMARRVAALSLVGFPLTLGFQGRWLLYRELVSAVPLVLLVVVAGTALAAETRPGGLPFIPALGRHRPARAAAGVTAAALVLLGVWPALLGPILVAVTAATSPSALLDLASTATAPTAWLGGILLLAAILIPAAVGAVVRRAPPPRDPGQVAQRTVSRRLLRLTPVAELVAQGVPRAGAALQQASGLIQGRRVRVWTFLAVVVVAVLPLRPSSTGSVGSAGGLATLLVLAMATLTAAAMLLSSRPGVTLGALALGYGLTSALLVATSGLLAVGLIYALAGTAVVVILAMAVAQMPIDRHLARAARRLGTLRGGTEATTDRLVLTLALAVAVLVALGIQSVSFPLDLPAEILRTTWVLVAGGVLTTLTARSPLRLLSGVFLAIAGFQLAYARLDPGVLVAAGLAMFQLVFAVVAAYYVGLAARAEGPT